MKSNSSRNSQERAALGTSHICYAYSLICNEKNDTELLMFVSLDDVLLLRKEYSYIELIRESNQPLGIIFSGEYLPTGELNMGLDLNQVFIRSLRSKILFAMITNMKLLIRDCFTLIPLFFRWSRSSQSGYHTRNIPRQYSCKVCLKVILILAINR